MGLALAPPNAPAPGRVESRGVVALAAIALALGCGVSATPPPAVFEMAEVVAPGTPGALRLPSFDLAAPATFVVAPKQFTIAWAKPLEGVVRQPALSFEIVPGEQADFSAWTRARIGRSVTVLIDRRVTTVATIMSPLPSGGIIEFRGARLRAEEVEEIARRLAP